MSSNGTTQKLDQLFPEPSLPPSQLSPQRLPGAGLESLAALQEVLKDNHHRNHIYFNESHFHNHITHRALAIYGLGGSAAVIRDYYKHDNQVQRSAFESPEPITEQNFVDHLGDDNFYTAYMSFFTEKIFEQGVTDTIEEFIFSEKYNFQNGGDTNTRPDMLARFISALLHAMIHVGYGLEFGLKGMVVEGLAQAAIHPVDYIPFTSFTSTSTIGVDQIANRLSSLALGTHTPVVTSKGGVHAFDIVARILKDDRLDPSRKPRADFINNPQAMLTEYYPTVREHAEKWTVDLDQPGEIERKMEELIWLSSLVYGIGGWTSNGFQSDFFLMHLVTSSTFVPSLIAYLCPRSQVLLLRSYLFSVLSWWALRGRPALNIKSFMTTTSVELPIGISPAPKTPLSTETTPTPNPFLPILQSAITHPNDHFVKIQRAFGHFDTLYGRRPVGHLNGTQLEDAELLDGSLFLRAALLTADSVGWVREGKEARQFSFQGFFT